MNRIRKIVTSIKKHSTEHKYALLIVFLGCIIGQVLTLRQKPLVMLTPDSYGYIAMAKQIKDTFSLANPGRTFGYPLFVAIIFSAVGNSTKTVVIMQALLTIIAMFGFYYLAFRIIQRKFWSSLIVFVFAINIYVLSWERTILTETLSWILAVAVFISLEQYLKTQNVRFFLLTAPLAGLAILVRPFFIFIPILIAAIVLTKYIAEQSLRRSYLNLILFLVLSYGIVGSQVIINATSNYHYIGITYISNVNLLGKIIEYQMEDQTTNPKYDQIKRDMHTFVITQHTVDPWLFLEKYPQYVNQNYTFVGGYASDIIIHHPVAFLSKTIHDVVIVIMALPSAYPPTIFRSFEVNEIYRFSGSLWQIYDLLPLITLILLYRALRKKDFVEYAIQWSLLLFIWGTIVVTAFGSYAEYDRLRFPSEWAMLILTAWFINETLEWYTIRHIQTNLNLHQTTIHSKIQESEIPDDEELAATSKRSHV